MRLSRIKLAGFKSFVDPTTLQFNSNLTAVLGPNGCGKSNTIDAVRWVMGESSAKNLRGDSMTDVIFNGSSGRKPVSKASVELVFDNSDHEGSPRLGGQYASFNEIAVRREVTREGQSNYFLNGAKCRRRDITDIFLGTGLGPRSYAIIEQGTISRLIEAKPEEMRVFLEEAAGISKYKERRKETENRIKHTRENLDRLDDVRHELNKQIERLQRQAKAAEKYKLLQAESRDAKGTLMGLRLREINAEIQSYAQNLNEKSVAVESALAELRHVEAELEKNREEQAGANENFNEVQGRYYAVGADISRLEGEIKHQQQMSQQQTQELEQVSHAVGELRGHQQRDVARLEELEALLAELEPRLEGLAATAEEAAEAYQTAEEAMDDWQDRWDAHNSAAATPTRSAEVEQTRISHLERELQQRVQRHDRLEQERKEMSPENGGSNDGVESLSIAAESAAAQSEEIEDQLAEVNEQLKTCRDQEQQTTQRNHEQAVGLQRLEGRIASLQALVKAAGKQDSKQSGWLAEQGLESQPRLLDQLRVESGWETAVEAALGGLLTALSVDELDQLLPSIDVEAAAGLAFHDGVAVSADKVKDSLLDKVRGGEALAPWLAHVRCVDSLAEALNHRGELAAHQLLITKAGDRVGPNWMQRAGEGEHALQNAEELRQIEQELESTRQAREAGEEQLAELREQRGQAESQREQLQAQLKQALQVQQQAQSELQRLKAKQEAQQRRREGVLHELEEVKQYMRRDDEELKAARSRLEVATNAMSDSVGAGERLRAEKEQLQAQLLATRERYRGDRETSQQLQLQIETRRAERESMQSNSQRLDVQLNNLLERQMALESSLEVGDNPGEELRAELEEKLALRVQVEARLTEARKELETFQHGYREADQRRMQAEQGYEQKRQAMETGRLGEQEFKTRRETLVEQIREEEFDPKELLAQNPDSATVDEAIRQLNELQQKISRLGAINLAAIEEYEQESERKEYLDAQHADLVEALETLEEAIHKIDKETRDRFRETFDKVNSGLQGMFPRLFGGGHASLEMTGDDLLTAGVNVMARPPGKRNSSIHLLSGGEKALTAVALVFAIFELNPAPFCMLDEVDAPLDDANVGRFSRLVKAMSDRVQFIFITHNKVTMEAANQLLGVTMQEPGVSRLVTVDIGEALKMVG